MAGAINIPGYGDIVPLSPDAERLVQSDDAEHPANLIPELCREFYSISMRKGPLVYLAPSGVQKERILPEHMFVLPFAQSSVPKPGSKRDMVRVPAKAGLSESQCTPLFWNAFTQRNAESCIHTHSQNAGAKSFRISHQEMIKGVRLGGVGKTLAYFNTLEVPIIENTAREEDLTDSMAAAMQAYPDAAAILVRRHGVYVWGPTWESAKTQAECLDYLFEIAVKMIQAGMPLEGDN